MIVVLLLPPHLQGRALHREPKTERVVMVSTLFANLRTRIGLATIEVGRAASAAIQASLDV
jgi:hypothetical protein